MPTLCATRRSPSLRGTHGRRIARPVNRPVIGQYFDVEVSREVDGWLIRIPEIQGVTRARRWSRVELAARTCIAGLTGIPMGYVAVLIGGEIG